mgnify:CR=1 FL=1
MRSKKMILIILAGLFIGACTDHSIPRHQTRLNETSAQEVEEEVLQKDFSQYGSEHKKIDAMIKTEDVEQVNKALSLVEKQIFAPNAKDPIVYTSQSYYGFVHLY